MKKTASVILVVAALMMMAVQAAQAAPDRATIFALLENGQQEAPPLLAARTVSLCQDDGWGWGDDGSSKPDSGGGSSGGGSSDGGWSDGGSGEPGKKPDDSGRAQKPPEGGGGWGDEWGPGDESAGPEDGPPEGDGEGEDERIVPKGPKVNWAKKLKIGLDIGGFLPFGEKEEAFSTGQIAALFLGFGLMDMGGITLSNQIRIGEGYTTSLDQTNGYDLTTLLIIIRDELQFHFNPMMKSFDFFLFLGGALALESSSGSRINPATGLTEKSSGFYYGFLLDAGLGITLNISGPVDLLLRLEFNFIPVTENVQFFMVGELGLQIRI